MTWAGVVAAVASYVGITYGWPLGVGVAIGGWLGHSWLWPWKRCPLCKGDAKNRDQSGRFWNELCVGCDNRGKKLRWGARLLGRRGFGKM